MRKVLIGTYARLASVVEQVDGNRLSHKLKFWRGKLEPNVDVRHVQIECIRNNREKNSIQVRHQIIEPEELHYSRRKQKTHHVVLRFPLVVGEKPGFEDEVPHVDEGAPNLSPAIPHHPPLVHNLPCRPRHPPLYKTSPTRVDLLRRRHPPYAVVPKPPDLHDIPEFHGFTRSSREYAHSPRRIPTGSNQNHA